MAFTEHVKHMNAGLDALQHSHRSNKLGLSVLFRSAKAIFSLHLTAEWSIRSEPLCSPTFPFKCPNL